MAGRCTGVQLSFEISNVFNVWVAGAAPPSSTQKPTGFYDLVAVLTHKGRSADSGHYVAWVKQESGERRRVMGDGGWGMVPHTDGKRSWSGMPCGRSGFEGKKGFNGWEVGRLGVLRR